MNRYSNLLLAASLIGLVSHDVRAQDFVDQNDVLHAAVVINSFGGDRAGPETDTDAAAMANGGLMDTLANLGVEVHRVTDVALTEQQSQHYGQWNRFGMANGHLASAAAENLRSGWFNIGLYNNCSSAPGMVGGLQQAGVDDMPATVAMIWIDAHGDYNTPETTLSGMLGGMPVAVTAGHALDRMREQSGQRAALPTEHIVMACVRDTDPLEQDRIEASQIQHISVEDVRGLTENLNEQMDRLSQSVDYIYVHIDLDVLDPAEIPGHPLTVENGPTSHELAGALEVMFSYPKTVALGLASYPEQEDPGLATLRAVYRLVEGAILGVRSRAE